MIMVIKKSTHMWQHFKITNLGEYHYLYLKTDFLFLTDAFENFRTKCLEPAQYYMLPNFSRDATVLKKGVTLEIIYDEDLCKMVEKGLRCGMCQCSI